VWEGRRRRRGGEKDDRQADNITMRSRTFSVDTLCSLVDAYQPIDITTTSPKH
jgi:hypothetical protein